MLKRIGGEAGLALVVAFLAMLAGQAHGQAAKPNILWIIADDWGMHASAFGTAGVNTPNIDQLVSEGTTFTSTFTTAPVCSAMRSALITGMYQTSIGAQHHRTQSKQSLPAGVDPITKYFKDAGYYTSNGNANLNGNGKTDYNFTGSFGSIFNGNDWRDRPNASTPFFSQVQIFDPHRYSGWGNTDPNRPNELDLPDYYPDHELTRKDYADYLDDVETFDTKLGVVLNRLENDGLADNTIVMVFGDHGAPHIRDKQWLYDGGIHIPLIIRDPTGTFVRPADGEDDRMISHIDISATSLALAGINPPSHLQGVDFSAAGYEGREAIFAAKDRLDGVVDRVRSVQVGDMKLIRNFDPGTPYMTGDIKESGYRHDRYPVHTLMKVMNGRGLLTPEQANFLTDSRPEFELYDLSSDPNEFYNLADDPAYAGVLSDLRQRIEDWMVDTGDRGGDFDPDAVSSYNSMRDGFETRLANRAGGPDATDYEYLQWWANEYRVELNLPQTTPDPSQVRLPNRSWENTNLNNGAWDVSTPQGWTESNSTVVQNHRATQIAQEAHHGQNALILNSNNGWTRWAVDDNWGNLVEFDEALGLQFNLTLWIGRRSDSQGDDPGVLEVSLQNEAGDKVLALSFDLDGAVAKGTWVRRVFMLPVTQDVVDAAGGSSQLYLALGNAVQGLSASNLGRVLVDDMSLAISAILPGDYNLDGVVDAADYTVWRDNLGVEGPAYGPGDGDGDGVVTTQDYLIWKARLGQKVSSSASVLAPASPTPEPASGCLTLVLGSLVGGGRTARRKGRPGAFLRPPHATKP